jgi:hypothetical protein
MIPLQLLLLGLPAVPIWVAGIVTLFRDPRLRPVRALAVAYLLMVAVLLVIAGQPYYTAGLLLALYAIGCAPTERWLSGRRVRQVLVAAGLVVNIALGVVVALPLVPESRLAGTPIGEVNQTARDQIGWQAYVHQVADVYAALPPDERARAVVLTGNYGEAGAVDRYGPRYGLPKVYSGQNELYHLGHPPDSATVVIMVWQGGPQFLAERFESCTDAGRLDNRVGVHNEEQDEARLYVCRGPRKPWSVLWPRFQHFD